MKKSTIKNTNLKFNSIPSELGKDISRLFENTRPLCNISKSVKIKNNKIKFNDYTYRVGDIAKNKNYKIFKDIAMDTEYINMSDTKMNVAFHREYVYSGQKICDKEYLLVEFISLSKKVKDKDFKYIVTPVREIKENNCDYLVYPKFLFELNNKNKKEIKSFIRNAYKQNKKINKKIV